MATKIEWTDETWNPVVGCSRVSEGCRNCYAEKMAHRLQANPKTAMAYDGTVKGGRWTGQVNLLPDVLDEPLRWKKPRRVFVDSMSDLFHDSVPDAFIARVFEVMHYTPQHTYQILTKRAKRMRDFVRKLSGSEIYHLSSNVWLGVSVEDQRAADERIPLLLQTPAAVRFLSCEPLLGPVDLHHIAEGDYSLSALCAHYNQIGGQCTPDWSGWHPDRRGVDWVIVGGESGTGARPMHPDWARSLRDQCQAAKVPFFFKHWGQWKPVNGESGVWQDFMDYTGKIGQCYRHEETGQWKQCPRGDRPVVIERVGKKVAGRELDGRTCDEFPGEA